MGDGDAIGDDMVEVGQQPVVRLCFHHFETAQGVRAEQDKRPYKTIVEISEHFALRHPSDSYWDFHLFIGILSWDAFFRDYKSGAEHRAASHYLPDGKGEPVGIHLLWEGNGGWQVVVRAFGMSPASQYDARL